MMFWWRFSNLLIPRLTNVLVNNNEGTVWQKMYNAALDLCSTKLIARGGLHIKGRLLVRVVSFIYRSESFTAVFTVPNRWLWHFEGSRFGFWISKDWQRCTIHLRGCCMRTRTSHRGKDSSSSHRTRTRNKAFYYLYYCKLPTFPW